MSDLHSVSDLLVQLKQNQSTAAHQLWGRFIDQLIRAADGLGDEKIDRVKLSL
ncbi:MAG: hypothetical protein NTU79_09360 [Planctomycetota bacterium]|nr:hypothetical protein [Planctomycetota bacterium]